MMDKNYTALEVYIGHVDSYDLDEEGNYIKSVKKDSKMTTGTVVVGTAFQLARQCCVEVAEKCDELIGQKVFPTREGTHPVVFQLLGTVNSYIWIPNLMNKVTAAGLIHFLSHLDGASARRLKILPSLNQGHSTPSTPQGLLNQRIFEVLHAVMGKPLQFSVDRVEKYTTYRPHSTYTYCLSLGIVKTARQLAPNFHGTVYSLVRNNEVVKALKLIVGAGPYCSKLRFEDAGDFRSVDIDHIILDLQEFSGEVTGLVPDVQFSFRRPVILYPWPVSCSRNDFQAVEGIAENGGDGEVRATTDYCYSFFLESGVNVRVKLVNVRKYHVHHEKVHRIKFTGDEEERNSRKEIIISDESRYANEDGVSGLKLTISNP